MFIDEGGEEPEEEGSRKNSSVAKDLADEEGHENTGEEKEEVKQSDADIEETHKDESGEVKEAEEEIQEEEKEENETTTTMDKELIKEEVKPEVVVEEQPAGIPEPEVCITLHGQSFFHFVLFDQPLGVSDPEVCSFCLASLSSVVKVST